MRIVYLILIIVCAQDLTCQMIFQSPEYPIRNDNFYEVFYMQDGGTMLFRDRNNTSKIDFFNEDMEEIKSVNYQINASKSAIESLNLLDSIFQIIYTYRKDRKFIIAMDLFNPYTYKLDSTIILSESDVKFVQGGIRSVISQDNSKTLLFGTRDGRMRFIVVDNLSRAIIGEAQYDLKTMNIREDFRKVVLGNDGQIILLFERKNKKFTKEGHELIFASSLGFSKFEETYLPLENILSNRIKSEYDNKTGTFYVASLYANKTLSDLNGYLICKVFKDGSTSIDLNEFSKDLAKELFGYSANRKKTIRDFYLTDLILREDGGVLLVSEMQKEFVRRASYSTMSRYGGSNYGLRGFVDYYNEDIIITSVNSTGEEDWYKVLYKKQFSQDDDGAFSSYYLMKTPSRLRLLYNDEIKKSNTVSEYLMDPSGKYERNAILNTEYQNLQLRFRDALQASSNTLIIPSENNFKLSLVKMKVK